MPKTVFGKILLFGFGVSSVAIVSHEFFKNSKNSSKIDAIEVEVSAIKAEVSANKAKVL